MRECHQLGWSRLVTVVGLLELVRGTYPSGSSKRRVLYHATHSSVANSTSSTPSTGRAVGLQLRTSVRSHRPPFWRDWLALAVAVLTLGALVAVASALGIE